MKADSPVWRSHAEHIPVNLTGSQAQLGNPHHVQVNSGTCAHTFSMGVR